MLELNPKVCKGCGICVNLCPKGVLALDDTGKITIKDESLCIQCRICEDHCPDYVIYVRREK